MVSLSIETLNMPIGFSDIIDEEEFTSIYVDARIVKVLVFYNNTNV